jgi:dihydroneopterin aldolase
MAEIALKGMEFFAYHGCFKEEQVIGTKFKVDLFVKYDVKSAKASDDLNDTIDYQALYSLVKYEMRIRSNLLEHVASRIINSIVNEFPKIQHIKIKIAKLNPPIGGQLKHVSVTIEYPGTNA